MKRPRRKAQARKLNLPDWLDHAGDALENIATIAGLMQGTEMEELNPGLVAHAGKMILGEAEKLHDLLERLEIQSVKR